MEWKNNFHSVLATALVLIRWNVIINKSLYPIGGDVLYANGWNWKDVISQIENGKQFNCLVKLECICVIHPQQRQQFHCRQTQLL